MGTSTINDHFQVRKLCVYQRVSTSSLTGRITNLGVNAKDAEQIQWLGRSDLELWVSIFPIDSLLNGEQRSYLEFPK